MKAATPGRSGGAGCQRRSRITLVSLPCILGGRDRGAAADAGSVAYGKEAKASSGRGAGRVGDEGCAVWGV